KLAKALRASLDLKAEIAADERQNDVSGKTPPNRPTQWHSLSAQPGSMQCPHNRALRPRPLISASTPAHAADLRSHSTRRAAATRDRSTLHGSAWASCGWLMPTLPAT